MPKYYHAYDDRYRAIHKINHTWATDEATPIVLEMIEKCAIDKMAPMLEIGCGEGRDSVPLLERGYNLTASDVSAEAIRFCKEKYPQFSERFKVVDACADTLGEAYKFIFATAVLHMLTEDADRAAFLNFIYRHLDKSGTALILTMGDGESEFCTDKNTAFDLQERTNNASGVPVVVTNTTCRMVSFATLTRELEAAHLKILYRGITSCTDFSSMLYTLVTK